MSYLVANKAELVQAYKPRANVANLIVDGLIFGNQKGVPPMELLKFLSGKARTMTRKKYQGTSMSLCSDKLDNFLMHSFKDSTPTPGCFLNGFKIYSLILGVTILRPYMNFTFL